MGIKADDPFYFAMTEICRGVMDAIGNQPGDTPERKAGRRRAVADTMSSMQPNDPLETMLAGQCVVFDHMVREAATSLLSGQTEAIKLRLRPQIFSASRMLLANLAQFRQSQADAEAKLGNQPGAAPNRAEAAVAAAKAPAPAKAPASKAAAEPAPAPNPEPARANPAAGPAPAQPLSDPPTPMRRELLSLLERHGLTTADTDAALVAAYRDLPPPDRGPVSASPMPGEPKQTKRAQELV
jgi:hypothetical protein